MCLEAELRVHQQRYVVKHKLDRNLYIPPVRLKAQFHFHAVN